MREAVRSGDDDFAAVSALREAEQRAQHLAARLRAVVGAASGLIQAKTLERLQAVLREACEQVIPLDYCTLGLYDPADETLRFERSVDAGLHVENPQVLPLADSPSEPVVRGRRTIVIHRSTDPSGQGAAIVGTGRRSESVIRTPVLAGERVLGVLSVQSYTPDLYREQDVEVLEALAAIAATAILNIEYLAQRAELEAQLRQAQKMEAVGRLAGGVAHDFNNLLTAIQGNTALVLSELDNDHPLRLELQEVFDAAERAADLTRQLLAFGRQQIVRPGVLSLNDQIEQVQGLLRRLIPANIEIRTRLDPSLGAVLADPGQVDQILLNLVVNARDAMAAGGTIVIETHNHRITPADRSRHAFLLPGTYAVLEVRDSGVGMDEKTLARVFEPFFSTKPQGKGTGLGLATVYGIVQQSGGHVAASSRPGEGSTFTIYLPRVEPATDATVAQPASRTATRGTETILVVEDEAPVRRVTRRGLERNGYTVIEAENAEDALRLFTRQTRRPDLLLTDIMMSGMDGHTLAAQLRAIDPALKIVFTSGYPAGTSSGRDLLPETAFVQKPFTPHGLASAIRAALDRPGC